MPVTTLGIAQGVSGLANTGIGLAEYLPGRKLAKSLTRPTYTIPPEIAQNMSAAELAAMNGLPDEQKKQFVDNIQRSASYTLGSAANRGVGLGALATTNQQSIDAYGNLMSADAQARLANQGALTGARNTMGEYENQAFQINEEQPYQQGLAAARGLQGAGIQTISKAIPAIGGAVGGLMKSGDSVAPYGLSTPPSGTTTDTTNSYAPGFNALTSNANDNGLAQGQSYFNSLSERVQNNLVNPGDDEYDVYNSLKNAGYTYNP